MKNILVIIVIGFLTGFSFGQEVESSIVPADSAKLLVSFIVEKDGSIRNVKVDKIECFQCSKSFKKNVKNEAIRVVSGIKNMGERKESVKYILPINFKVYD